MAPGRLRIICALCQSSRLLRPGLSASSCNDGGVFLYLPDDGFGPAWRLLRSSRTAGGGGTKVSALVPLQKVMPPYPALTVFEDRRHYAPIEGATVFRVRDIETIRSYARARLYLFCRSVSGERNDYDCRTLADPDSGFVAVRGFDRTNRSGGSSCTAENDSRFVLVS